MNHMRIVVYLIFLTVGTLIASDARAACDVKDPLNQSYKDGKDGKNDGGFYADHTITDCVKRGEDPVKSYLRSEGKAFSRTKMHAILPRSVRTATALPNAYKDQTCEVAKKKAGGFTTQGAIDPCKEGAGTALTSFPPQQVNIPICEDCNDCGLGILGALLGAFTGGTPPDLSSTFTAKGNASRNGCISGSIGICGLGSIGGSVCPSALIAQNGMQNPQRPTTDSNNAQSNNENPSYIRINAPSLQIATPKTNLHNGTTNYFPDGGLLRVCASTGSCWDVEVPINGHAVIDSEGVLRVGCPTCPQAGSGEYIVGRDGMGGTGRTRGTGGGRTGAGNSNSTSNSTSTAFDLDSETVEFNVTLIPNSNMQGETVILADENLVQGSGPQGISSLNVPVSTQQVVSCPPNGSCINPATGNNVPRTSQQSNGTNRVPELITVPSIQTNNTRLPTAQTLDTLLEAEVPNSTCPTGGTSCFSGSFAPLAPTESEMPPEINNPNNAISKLLLD